ncbi:glycosyltransferase [Alteromonas oceanisediminis]|uniref:glycosyltransferase n=1 Tax=Alteromonas oceanisediminis TaxID=2836180 RepID=UPI001BDB299C|nr:glycosyltransferase [Alteromonas oceanisediminis]MBT0587080.1 hypothetical protein [Alteromonas oceanisediminis]
MNNSSNKNKKHASLLFYVHHHGEGHISRARLLVPTLATVYRVVIVFIDPKVANKLSKYSDSVEFQQLPSKWATRSGCDERMYCSAFEGIEFSRAPLERAIEFNAIVKEFRPICFISDVSAELTIAARSIGLPVLMQRHSGDISGDPTQVFAYECASKLYAPFPKYLEATSYKYNDKTHYLNFISKYSSVPSHREEENTSDVTILMNDPERAAVIAKICTEIAGRVVVIGCEGRKIDNVVWKGRVSDISMSIDTALVITSCGNNAVSELLSLRKRIIVIPENRPYGEQLEKAKMLHKRGLAIYLPWKDFINQRIDTVREALKNATRINSEGARSLFDHPEVYASKFLSLVKEIACE